MDEIPDWCPLPDADKLVALLEDGGNSPRRENEQYE